MELRAGVRLDRYTLVLPLGEGGQAVVWKAIDPLEGGSVRALKVFRLSGSSPHVAERARREAKASAGAQHPGLLPCRTLFEDPAAEIVALVFDYVRGHSLVDALTDRRMTADHRRCALRQIADVLAYVHERDVIHRDVKPDNVLVTDAFWGAPHEPGTLKLVDFGIAAPAGNPNPLTREGVVVGTAPYLAPELLETEGLFGRGTDFQRDVFAFGVLAWEVLVGKHPTGLALDSSRDAFAGAYLGARAGNRPWPPENGISIELRVAAACLSLTPADRPESAAAIARALRSGDLSALSSKVVLNRDSRPSSPVTITHDAPNAGVAIDSGRTSTEPMQISLQRPPVEIKAPNSSSPPYSQSPRNSQSPRSAPVASRRESVRKAAASTKGQRTGRGWIAILVGALLLAGALFLGGAYLLTKRTPVEQPQPPPDPVTPPSASATSAPSPAPPPPPVKPTPKPSGVICCPGSKSSCESGRRCTPGCPSDHVNEKRPFRLRVRGGFVLTPGKIEIQLEWQTSQICLKNTRTGESSCAQSSTLIRENGDWNNRILATPEDLQKGDITVTLLGTGLSRGAEKAFGYPHGYSTQSLCDGITISLGNYEKPTGKIYLYLDDP